MPHCCHRSKWYQCYTDEHYFGTVLAVYGRGPETDCLGHSVAADWTVHSSHPHSYAPEEVNATLCVRFIAPMDTVSAVGNLLLHLRHTMHRAGLRRGSRSTALKVCIAASACTVASTSSLAWLHRSSHCSTAAGYFWNVRVLVSEP